MSIQAHIDYYCKVSELETQFRDLFGKEELEEVRKQGYAQIKPYLEFLQDEIQRKLREQDGD